MPSSATNAQLAPLTGPVKLRVLHVISGLSPRFGGPANSLELCRALGRQGVQVSLFTNNLAGPGKWLARRGPVRPLGRTHDLTTEGLAVRYFATEWPFRFGYSPTLGHEISKRIREFDVVHIHGLYLYPSSVAAFYARQAHVPYIIEPHGSLAPYIFKHHRYRKWIYELVVERRNLRHAAALHYASGEEMRQAQAIGVRVPALVIPLGINIEDFDRLPRRGSFRACHPHLHGKRLIVFLGRLTRKKGLDLLVEAFVAIADRFSDLHLIIAGPDDEGLGSRLRRRLAQAGLSDRTLFPGMLLGDQKRSLLADTDVWVLPSYDENFGIAAVEAMACGLPVVISDKVHIWPELAKAQAAVVVPCRVRELAAAIEGLLSDRVLRSRLGENARLVVRNHFTWESSAKKLINAYQAMSLRSQNPGLAD